MKKLLLVIVSALLLLSLAGQSGAVNFEEELKKLAEENAKGYIGPFATAFGTDMNSGLYQTAKPHKLPGFDVTVKFSMATVAEEDLTFDFILPTAPVPVPDGYGIPVDTLEINLNRLYPDRSTPTVFGDDQPATLQPDLNAGRDVLEDALIQAGMTQGEVDALPQEAWDELTTQLNTHLIDIETVPGIGFDVMPLAMPQISVGLPMRSEVMLRMIPATDLGDEFGEVSFLGLGLKHSISQYLPMFPIDVSAQFAWQQLKLGDLIESTHTAFNVQASKKLGIGISLTPYVGLGMESSNIKIAYDIEGLPAGNPLNGQHVEFDLNGDNSFRATAGIRLVMAIISINVDYSMGAYSCISTGLGLTFR